MSGNGQPGASQVDASADEVAQAVARVWSEVLGVHPVGVEDDFFSLGGDSMLASEAAAAVRDQLGLAATLRLVFEAPRPCDFAAALVPSAGEAAR